METITLPQLPDTPICIALVKEVKNTSFLRQQLLAGNQDYEYAFLDASVLLSRTHILAACFRAINDWKNERLKTRNVHSEIVFSLSPNNNIAESFRRFGISDTSTNMVAIKIAGDAKQVEEHLKSNVQGVFTALTDDNLLTMQDQARIRKIYRIEAPKKDAKQDLHWNTEAFVLGSMALKGS